MKTRRLNYSKSLPALLVSMLLLFSSCIALGERGNGNVVKEDRKIGSFDAIDISGSFDVILAQGTAPQLIIEADENLMKNIRTDVEGSKLIIEYKKPIQHAKCMKAYITVTSFKSIEISGAVDIVTEGRITVPELMIDGSGATDSKLDIDVQKLVVDCSGGSSLKLRGLAREATVDISGAVDLFAYDLVSEIFTLDVSGACDAQVNVSKELTVDISGAGSVYYKGNPARINEHVSGAGSVKKTGD